MKQPVLILLLMLLIGGMASAQDNYEVTHDSTGFKMIQYGQATPFDTAFVSASIREKAEAEATIKAEITLLEELIQRRRQLSAVIEEKKVLADILKKAQQCVTH